MADREIFDIIPEGQFDDEKVKFQLEVDEEQEDTEDPEGGEDTEDTEDPEDAVFDDPDEYEDTDHAEGEDTGDIEGEDTGDVEGDEDGKGEIIDYGNDYKFGVAVPIEQSGLNEDDEESIEIITANDSSFISATGDIVVQDKNDTGDNFKLKYIPIENIAVPHKRVRLSNNVDTLVQSIRSTGLLKPLDVAALKTDNLYVLIDGYRRIIACAKVGIKKVPCVVNTKINTPDIPILEALYNHSKAYTIQEIIEYIDYIEKEKGILSASMIEYLLQMDSGDYTKLKDILNDNDDDIVSAMMNGQLTIGQAFKKLEQRRKKESKEEQEQRKVEQVYGDTKESGVEQIAGSGEEGTEAALSDEEIASLAISSEELNNADNESLETLAAEGDSVDGFEAHKQDYHNREMLDPALRKAVLVRDDNTCQCCGLSGQEYTEVLDIHHKVEVYLGGSDDIDNLLTTCVICHKLVHLYARGELHIRPESDMTAEEVTKFKKIVKLGTIIRKGMALKGMKKDELKKADKAETIGRTKPGTARQVAT